MIRISMKLGTTAVLAGLLLATAVPANATLQTCQTTVSGMGRGPTMGVAHANAVKHWVNRTKVAHGTLFTVWSEAKDKGRSCNRKDGIHYCRVHARPCTPAGSSQGVNKNPV